MMYLFMYSFYHLEEFPMESWQTPREHPDRSKFTCLLFGVSVFSLPMHFACGHSSKLASKRPANYSMHDKRFSWSRFISEGSPEPCAICCGSSTGLTSSGSTIWMSYFSASARCNWHAVVFLTVVVLLDAHPHIWRSQRYFIDPKGFAHNYYPWISTEHLYQNLMLLVAFDAIPIRDRPQLLIESASHLHLRKQNSSDFCDQLMRGPGTFQELQSHSLRRAERSGMIWRFLEV